MKRLLVALVLTAGFGSESNVRVVNTPLPVTGAISAPDGGMLCTEATAQAINGKLTTATEDVHSGSGLVTRSIIPDHMISAFGGIKTAQDSPVVTLQFNYSINPYFAVTTLGDGGSADAQNSMAVLNSGAGVNGYAVLESRNALRYVAGQGNLGRWTAAFPNGCNTTVDAGTVVTQQEIGIGDNMDGWFVGCRNDAFGLFRRQGGTDTFYPQTSWTNPVPFVGYDITKLNVYEVQFQWLGAGAQKLLIEDPAAGHLEQAHEVQYANSALVPSIMNPTLPLHVRTFNAGNASNHGILTASMGGYTEGPVSTEGAPGSTSASKTVTTTETALFTVRVKSTFQGKTGRVRIALRNMWVENNEKAGSTDAHYRLLLNTTLGGTDGGTFADFDTTTSVVDIDTAGTTVTGGREIWNAHANAAGDPVPIDLTGKDLILHPGDTVTMTAAGATTSAAVSAGLQWVELFSG